METQSRHREALLFLHYVFPAVTLVYFVIAQTFSLCSAQSTQNRHLTIKRKPIVLLQFAVLTLFTFEASFLVINDLISYPDCSSADGNFHILFEVLIWTLLSATLLESNDHLPWYPLYGSWIICLASELILFGFEIPAVTPFRYRAPDPFIYLRICLLVVRLALIALLLLLYFHRHTLLPREKDEESTALLRPPNNSATNALNKVLTYGSVQTEPRKDSQDADQDSERDKFDMKHAPQQKRQGSGDWIHYLQSFSVFIPLLWPSKQLRAQLSILGVVICLIAGRIFNLLLPRQFGTLIDSFSHVSTDSAIFPGLQLGIFLLYRFVTSYKVNIEIESSLWLTFGNYAVQNIKSAAHRKVMTLSREFHASRGADEMTKIVDLATTVTWLLRNFFMFLLPCVLDILIFGVYLSCVFGINMALLLSITLVVYVWISKHFAAKRMAPQATVLEISKEEDQLLYQSLSEWETVTCFNAQAHESERLARIIKQRLLAESVLQWCLASGNLCSEFALQLGFAIACALVIFQIVHGIQTVGSFAMVAFYIMNVSSDIHSVAVLGSSLLEDLVEIETLRDLLSAEPSVHDGPAVFIPYEGAVLLSGVNFAYDVKTPVIQDFNFSAKAGQQVAIVGETGSGKTTLLRLLLRLHDVQAGKIMIDGQDVRDVTLNSLRSAIGVVPPYLTLFDNSILENIRYARLGASDEEVVEACVKAGIHEKILSYADGYSTKVGEGNVELSDGEKQQIAIAQVALKNPRIILVDETPDSDDFKTEELYQKVLQRLTSGRTTFVIAHRLSTIQNADVVLVMKDGNIAEQGSPFELLEVDGEFAKIYKDKVGLEATEKTDETSTQEPPIINQHSKPTLNRHIKDRSASSFRPDAPEFVPHFQLSTESSSGQTSHPHLGPGHQHDSRDTPSHAQSHVVAVKKSSGSPSKRTHYKPTKKNINPARKSETSTETITANSHEDTPTSQLDGSAGPKLTDGKIAPRLSRWQRRRQARSDPNSSAVSSEQVEPATDKQRTDQKEASTVARRVSGPGKYPSESRKPRVLDVNVKETQKGSSQQNRRKRNQQSRLRKSEQTTSEDVAQNDEASVAAPTESPVSPRPVDSLSMPKDKENAVLGKD